jgi:hypothetical protein
LKKDYKCSKVTIYGEYAGEGVQKGVALANVKGNIFCVFAIQIDNDIHFEPKVLEKMMGI